MLQTQAVYAILAGAKVNWADVILENLGVTDVLGHTHEITLLLAHFKISNAESSVLTPSGLPFDSKSITLMFHESRPASSQSHPATETPQPTTPQPQSTTTPPPPRSVSEERFQILETRITSLADELGHVRSHQQAERLTIDSYFHYLSSQLDCLMSSNGINFPAYSCPSFFPLHLLKNSLAIFCEIFKRTRANHLKQPLLKQHLLQHLQLNLLMLILVQFQDHRRLQIHLLILDVFDSRERVL